MTIARVIFLRQAAEIEILLGLLYLLLAVTTLFFVWHFRHVAKLERKQSERIRRELSRRYNLRHKEPG